jgi:hypothetical protein
MCCVSAAVFINRVLFEVCEEQYIYSWKYLGCLGVPMRPFWPVTWLDITHSQYSGFFLFFVFWFFFLVMRNVQLELCLPVFCFVLFPLFYLGHLHICRHYRKYLLHLVSIWPLKLPLVLAIYPSLHFLPHWTLPSPPFIWTTYSSPHPYPSILYILFPFPRESICLP